MPSEYPLVSIVIPTYNQAEFIIRAVDSAVKQDYANLEIIVSDDSTNNATELLLKDYIAKNKIRYYHNAPRLGRVKNYRAGLYELLNGEWALNLDGDDYLTDMSFISTAIQTMRESSDKKITFIQAGGSVIDNTGNLIEKKLPKCIGKSQIVSGTMYLKEFAKRRRFLHLTSLYNTELARKIDFYRFDTLSSDLESFMRLALCGNVLLLNKDVGVWFQHSSNTSTNSSKNEIIENTSWIDLVGEFGIETKKLNKLEASCWMYLVKQQELTGLFMKDIKRARSKKDKLIRAFVVMRRYPKTFFFPVFLKKLIFNLL